MLSYTRQGEGPALVLLHYFGGAARTWQPVTNLLASGLDCLAPDLRGWWQGGEGGGGFGIPRAEQHGTAEFGAGGFGLA